MEGNLETTLLIVITVVAGITAQIVADFLNLPSIVFLLTFGVLLGPGGLNLLHPQLLGNGLDVIVSLCVALILFEGGLNLKWSEILEVSGSLRNLVTIGAFITLLGSAMVAHWLSEFPWSLAFLYASLVVVTGPTVVAPLLKQVNADRFISTLLEGEGVLIDPVGAILAVAVLNIVLQTHAAPLTVVGEILSRLLLGGIIGISGGWLMSLFLKYAKFLSEDLKNLSVLAALWGLFGLSQFLISESGLMCAVAMGMVLCNASLPTERLLRRFKNQLSVLSISVLFILLSADLSLASLWALGWGGLFTVLVLMVVVRPLNVLVSTWNSDLTWQQKTFISWVAPRGIVAASVASLFAISLTDQGINGGDAVKALVFLTIILTVFIQGLSARWVAGLLKVSSDEARGAIILGSSPMARLVAREIRDRDESVVIIDSNADFCEQARAEGLKVFCSSALDMDVMAEAGITTMGTVLAITNNPELNGILAQRVWEEFHPPRVIAVLPAQLEANSTQRSTDSLISKKVKCAFSEQVSLKIWNHYLAQQEIEIQEAVLSEDPQIFVQQCQQFQALATLAQVVPLLLQRQTYLRVLTADETWQPADRIIYAIHILR